jgi:uncharacterized protein
MPERDPSEPLCPICDRPTVRQFYPFCSRRCADVDLGRWLTGLYRVPAAADESDETGEPP